MGFLTGKTAIITGGGRATLSDGSSGSIGYGIATAYAKEGANLVITGRNLKKLEDAKSKLEKDYEIAIHDPHVKNPDFVSFKEAVNDADLILILCDHNEFKHLDYTLINEKTIIFDTKDIIHKVPSNIKLYNYGNLLKSFCHFLLFNLVVNNMT